MTTQLTIPLALCLSLSACIADDRPGGDEDKSDEDQGPRLAPVDISFLIPPIDGAPALHVDLAGEHGPLLTTKSLKTISRKTEFNETDSRDIRVPDGSTLYDNLAVTAVRYLPCGVQAMFHDSDGKVRPHNPKDCGDELHVVVQPWTGTQFAGAAVGLLYLGFDADALREDLLAMRKACEAQTEAGITDATPIGPHPCLSGPNARAFLQDQVIPLLKAHAGDKLLAAAALTVGVDVAQGDSTQVEWHWSTMGRAPLTRFWFLLPRLNNIDSNTAIFRQDGTYGGTVTAPIPMPGDSPVTTEVDPDAEMVNSTIISTLTTNTQTPDKVVENIDDPQVQNAILAAYMAENPRLTVLPDTLALILATLGLDDNIDRNHTIVECTSCHVQSSTLTFFEDAQGLEAAIDRNPKFKARLDAVRHTPIDGMTAENLAETRNMQIDLTAKNERVVFNFSYMFDTPSVSRRVSNEAADEAAFLTRMLRGTLSDMQ